MGSNNPPKPPVQKRKLQSFDGVIYLEDYIWATKNRPNKNKFLYGHALEAYYFQKELYNAEKLKETTKILESQIKE